jgi:hypothetical protein
MYHNKCKIFLSVIIACLYSVDALPHLQSMQDVIHDKPVTLQNILTTQPEDMSGIMSSGGALTITGSGTIHFLQAFFYSDTGCTTLLGAASAIDNVSGMTFTSGQTVSVNSSSVYQLANNQGITTGNIACMKLYVDGRNQSPSGVSCQSFTDESCSGTSCTSSQTKSVSWASGPTACATRYAYVVNSTANTVSKCTVNASTGALSGCASTGSGFTGPLGVNIINSYGYVTNNSPANTVSFCAVSASDGSFSNCSSPTSMNDPGQMTINAKYAYFPSLSGNNVTQCTIIPDISNLSTSPFSSCTTPVDPVLTNAQGIEINQGFAYVSNALGSIVSKCTVSTSDGLLSSCASTGSGFDGPRGIGLNNGFAYIANGNASTVTKCTISAVNGTLSSCASTGSGFSAPRDIAINNGFAYVTNSGANSVTKCTVNSSTGALASCAPTGSGFTAPRQIIVF